MLRVLSMLLLLDALTGTMPARAADAGWPSKPVNFIVPFPAGAVTDLAARIVGNKLAQLLKATVIIDNRTGASGEVGALAISRSAPDGYTVGLATSSTMSIAASLNPKLSYDPEKDFTPVSLIGDAPYVLAVNAKVPTKNVAELIALAREKPGVLNYSTVGPASLAQFAASLFSSMANVKLTAVPYRSATPAALDIAEGRIDMQFGLAAASLPFVRQGKIRALAVTSRARLDKPPLDVLPGVPTLSESGLPDYEAVLWTALVMPANSPPEIVARLNKAMKAALDDPAVRNDLARQVVQPGWSTPVELRQRIHDDIAKWRRIAAEAGIKPTHSPQ